MQGLMLHTGAQSVTREELEKVVTPQAEGKWHPIPHSFLLSEVEKQLTQAGFTISEESHGLTKDGDRWFGLLELSGNDIGADDFSIVAGVRNSNDKKFPASVALGAKVFVCDNLSFTGEVKLARRHTINIVRDLPELISRAIGKLGELKKTQQERFDHYKQFELTDTLVNDIIVNSGDAGIPWTKLPHVLKEYRDPRHVEFAEYGNTAWNLWNAYTETLKGNLGELPNRTQALHGVFDRFTGLLTNPITVEDLEDAELTISLN